MESISQSVVRVLSENGWCTGQELRQVTPHGQFDLACLLADGRAFVVQVPARTKWRKLTHEGAKLSFYHLSTPGTRQIMGFGDRSVRILDAMSLTSPLMQELIERLNGPRPGGTPAFDKKADFRTMECEHSFVDVLEAALPLTRRLEAEGLSAMRVRPDDGFLYPCRWTPHGTPRLTSQAFVFDIEFIGAIKRTMAPAILHETYVTPTLAYSNVEKRCTVRIHWDEAVITIQSVAEALVDPKRRKLALPPRSEIMNRTSKTIMDCALEDHAAAPFLAGENIRFRLLSDTSDENI